MVDTEPETQTDDMKTGGFPRVFWQKSKTQQRAFLLKWLRAFDVKTVNAEYDGYGDEGNVHECQVDPSKPEALGNPDFDMIELLLPDYIWGFCYKLHPGFENNEGAFGSFQWNIVTDKIDVSHHERFTETDTTDHEGL